MKRTALFVAAAALVIASSCSRRTVHPEIGTVTADTLLVRNGAECRIEYRFATIRNADKSPALQAIEQSNINYFFDLEHTGQEYGDQEYTAASLQEAIEASIRGIDTTYMPDRPGIVTNHSYEISVESEISLRDTLLTCMISHASYTGGAHGNYGTEYHTYSLTGGYEITTADLFTCRQMERIDELIVQKLCKKYNVADRGELGTRGFFPDVIGPTENFFLTQDSITFYYNPYDIACYATGAIEISVGWDELGMR